MSTMRMRLKLRGIYLYNDLDGLHRARTMFTFGGTNYYKILFDSGFSLDATYTTSKEKYEIVEFTETAEALITTERFIYPLIVKHELIVDGTVKGSTKIALHVFGAGDLAVWITKNIISLLKVDQDANETVLGTVTQDYTIGAAPAPSIVGHVTATPLYTAFPFFFDVHNKKVTQNERLIFEIKPYGLVTNPDTQEGRFDFAAAVDEDNQYIDIPIV